MLAEVTEAPPDLCSCSRPKTHPGVCKGRLRAVQLAQRGRRDKRFAMAKPQRLTIDGHEWVARGPLRLRTLDLLASMVAPLKEKDARRPACFK